MAAIRRWGQFTNEDPLSELLLDLCADRIGKTQLPATAGFLELAQRHGLIPLVADHVEDDLVRAIEARELARRRVLERHLFQILERLYASGIRTAVLKGPSVAARYRKSRHRQFSDIDILVPRDDVDSALDAIEAHPGTERVPAKRPKADKRDVFMRDLSGVRFNLDLHWDLFSYSQLRGSARGATDAAWAEAVLEHDSPIGPAWDLPEAYRIAFLASHAVLDHRFRLILFRDFFEIAASGVDWARLEEMARRWGLRSTTYLALWLSKAMLGAAVDESFLESVRPRSLPLSYLEWALPRTDVVRFDGHRPHPVNLASVLLNDSATSRVSLLARAPTAVPAWRRRVDTDVHQGSWPRTLILVSSNQRRGAEVFTERLRDGLVRRGWVVEAAALRRTTAQSTADVEVLTSDSEVSAKKFDWTIFSALLRKTRSFKPDLIVANGGSTLRYSLLAAIGRKTRVAYLSIGEPDYWIRSGLSRWANRLMLRRADLILSVSEATRRQTVCLEPSVSQRIHTTWTGLPPESFRNPSQPTKGPLRVLMVGSLSDEKDPALGLEATSQIPGARLRLVGDGPLLPDLQRSADRLGFADRVEFVGSVSDVFPHFDWAHVLLITSRSEGLPGAILEASAAGIPSVAVDVGGVSEAVVDGVGGFVVKRDVTSIVAALAKIDADRELLAGMGSAARVDALSRFTLDRVLDRYVELLSGVVQ